MNTIAVIGAGVMGCDVAMTVAAYGSKVLLKDINLEVLNKVPDTLRSTYRLYRMISPKVKSWDINRILSNIQMVSDYEEFIKADLVIENIVENYNRKSELYNELTKHCKPDVIYAVNTSCISITKIAENMPKPENVVGMHFMNPVPLKDVVEMIKGKNTSQETIDKSEEFLCSLGIAAIVVNDSPGFVVNRLSHLFMNEAAYLVQENVGTVYQIDALFKKGYGHKMGPLETADLIGLDTVVYSLDVLYKEYQDTKFQCCPLLRQMVASGLQGRKSKQGFYKY